MEQRFELSPWLYNTCMALWYVDNERVKELSDVGDNANPGNRLIAMRERARTWDRTAIMDYHMGNSTLSENGAIKWAFIHNSKVKALKYQISESISIGIDSMKHDLDCCRRILRANGQDEIKFAFIQNYYNYWDSLPDDDLYEI